MRTREVRSPFTLTYVATPTTVGTSSVPAGTCLVLRNTGGKTLRRMEVTHPDATFPVRVTGPLRAGDALGLTWTEDLVGYTDARDVFVDFVDHRGDRHSVWMRLPPVPGR